MVSYLEPAHHGPSRSLLFAIALVASTAAQQTRRFLYVAVPGAGNETEYRGVGILVYDIDNGHKLVKRIPTWPSDAGQQPEYVRGIAAHAGTRRLFVSTVKRLAAFDLVTEKIVWEKTYDGNCCDRIAVSPDGSTIYAPAFGAPRWRVIDAADGAALASIDVMGWPRQAMFSHDGAYAYLSAWESPCAVGCRCQGAQGRQGNRAFHELLVPVHD